MEFKKGTLADVMLLQQISIETFTDTFKEQNTEEDLKQYLEKAYTVDQLKKELANEKSSFFFLQDNEETVGYLKVNVEDAQTEDIAESAMEIERIYIRSHYKRKGYGKFLIEQAERFAQKANKKAIWLGVWEENTAALAFYKDRGFVQTSSHSFFMGDDEQTDLIMTKQLV
ncbi:GNAT family N-acetyltransferase [Carnobacterium antarcticum]|uniref:GNAT family N-acetyltransferase n=1 Tax=Carnobacterium antarcticum TaxID=2126436 RepID=A0ABW4NLM5_9LACT|nr:GNAT family N-acetyltransferase [Carnobacterium sp. CP1]ALV22193.1 negative regulation of sporulation, septation and degradative enzyme genes (aprE, nprE, phoA, sacB) [Carnobacterium sp. CP1]